MEGDADKTEGRLDERLIGLQVSVAVLTDQNARIMADVSELKRDAKDLLSRMEEGFQSLRKDMHDGFQSLRKEMYDGFQLFHKELSNAKIWALLIAAAMLGVLARGFHWI
jgi:hypothetical protein